MTRNNDNEAITLIAPSESIPVLIPHVEPRDGVVYEMSVTQPPLTDSYPVVVASLEALKRAVDSPRLFAPAPRKQLMADLQLADALEQGDHERAQGLVSGEQLSEQIVAVGATKRLKPEKPEKVLARHITLALANTRFVVWLDERVGKLRPGLVCGNQREAVYALLLQRLGRPGLWSSCKRCGEFFQKRRAVQPYCSSNCRSAQNMKEHRARQKAKNKGLKQRIKP